jgi:uncharacterized damage-inducible protein DinB
MTPCDSLRLLADYNAWMNKQIYSAAAQISDADRKADRGAFFCSVDGTLNHLLLVDRIWTARVHQAMPQYPALATATPPVFSSLADEQYADFPLLRQERRRIDAMIIDWVSEIVDADLDRAVPYATSKGVPRSFPLGVVVHHLFNHQSHHRGQVTAMLAQAGISYGETDLLTRHYSLSGRGG